MTKAEFHRAVQKLIHQHGEPLFDGRVALDVEAFSSALGLLEALQLAPKGDEEDDEREDGEQQYDPVAEGKELARKQIGELQRAKDRLR